MTTPRAPDGGMEESRWHDMSSAPTDGCWVHLRVRAFGEEYVSNHLWRWSHGWHSPDYPLTAYSAEPIAWSPA